MESKQVIIVYGGSFNPPLNSHFSIAQHALNQYEEAEKVIFVPVTKKYGKQGLIDDIHRYNMLKLVIDKNDRFLLSDIDLKSKDYSLTTIETLREIEKQFPNNELWFLMGSDNLKELQTWSGVYELIPNYKMLVMERDDDKVEEIIESNELLKKYKENIKKLNEDIRSNFSSRYVRSQIEKNKSVRYLLPDEVYEYIQKNHLYCNLV